MPLAAVAYEPTPCAKAHMLLVGQRWLATESTIRAKTRESRRQHYRRQDRTGRVGRLRTVRVQLTFPLSDLIG